MKQSCTYITTYSGNKLPPFYIGSSYLEKVQHGGYRGSVKSKEYKKIWDSELKENPHLFKTQIISLHNNRKDATAREYILQKHVNAPFNPMYINMAYATKNGCFGVSKTSQWKGKRGKECPWYGVKRNPENYKKSKTGAKNPSSKDYTVFNANHEIILECSSNLKNHCIEAGLPIYIASKLTKSNDKPLKPPISKSNNKSKLETQYPQYIGWYTKRINKLYPN